MPAQAPRVALEGRAIQHGVVAVVLAWLFPGAGHWYVGARGRSAAFCGLVLLTVFLGAAFDGNLAVLDARTPFLSRLQVASGLALGPMEPVLRLSFYGAAAYSGDDGGGALDPPLRAAAQRRKDRSFRTWSAYGSAYLLAAGLMNLLLLLDAWDIAIGRKE